MTHKLTITGGQKTFGISAICSCGWNAYINTTVRRGGIISKKDFLKSEYKRHKAGN